MVAISYSLYIWLILAGIFYSGFHNFSRAVDVSQLLLINGRLALQQSGFEIRIRIVICGACSVHFEAL